MQKGLDKVYIDSCWIEFICSCWIEFILTVTTTYFICAFMVMHPPIVILSLGYATHCV